MILPVSVDLTALGGFNARNLNFNSAFESTNYLNTPGIYSFSNSQGPLTGSSFNSSLLVLSAYYSVDLGYQIIRDGKYYRPG